MNQIIAGSTVLVITLVLWGLGRKPFQRLHKKNERILNNVSPSQVTLIRPSPDDIQQGFSTNIKPESNLEVPINAKERARLQFKIKGLMKKGPKERLEAIAMAQILSHSSVLPFLKQGLHDSDSRVTIAAAKALEKFRGKPIPGHSQRKRPPRNVARMR